MKIGCKKSHLFAIGIVLLLLAAALFLWIGDRDSVQAESPTIAGVSFAGEYRVGEGSWQEYVEGEHIPATRGDVTLRGIFRIHNPTTGEVIGPASPGMGVMLYMNHIGGTVILPNGYRYTFDAENERLGEDACAAMWSSVSASGDDPLTIILHNPHRYGNENAVDELFEHISVAPGVYHESMMLKEGALARNVALLVLIFSFIILGIAAFSTVIHIKYSRVLWMIGLMFFFAGGYVLFGAFAVGIWNDSNIVNTRALGISMMLYMLLFTALAVMTLRRAVGIVARGAVLSSGVAALVCILLSFSESVKFYDTWLFWAIFETAVSLVLIVCLLLGVRSAAPRERFLGIAVAVALAAFPADAVATAFGWWEGGLVSTLVFFVVFFAALVVVLRVIPSYINAAMRSRVLESEQKSLKLELQENRISIMLSQLQPHFIFNTLNTIYHLCELDPDKARKAISSFSEYLRNNIDNLERSDLIAFDKELSFVKTYLEIEKIRFDEELLIHFDIKATDFKLPALSVQPIVENAVKHGTSKKDGVSSLYISTRELEGEYVIEVRDTGMGFDPSKYRDDGHRHVGIENVRQRLENQCGGTLTVESTPGVGTTATIRIPQRRASDHEDHSGR